MYKELFFEMFYISLLCFTFYVVLFNQQGIYWKGISNTRRFKESYKWESLAKKIQLQVDIATTDNSKKF